MTKNRVLIKCRLLTVAILATSVSTLADSGFYGDISVGQSSHNINWSYEGDDRSDKDFESLDYSDENDISFGLRAGYQLFDYLAAEIGYFDYFATEPYSFDLDHGLESYGGYLEPERGGSAYFDVQAVTVGLKGIIPVTSALSLNGRVGIARWDWSAYAIFPSIPNEKITASETGNDFYYSIGMEYDFSRNFYMGLEYAITQYDWNYIEEANVVIYDLDGTITDEYSVEYGHKFKGKVSNIRLSFGMKF